MKIEISKKEYRDLLDILHMAEAVMSGHLKEEIDEPRAIRQSFRNSIPWQPEQVSKTLSATVRA